jgi:hypothetical protein
MIGIKKFFNNRENVFCCYSNFTGLHIVRFYC